MTMNVYRRPLQNALDDTRGGRLRTQVRSFEARGDMGESLVGTLRQGTTVDRMPVYSAAHVGPDISELKFVDKLFWVEAATVMSKTPLLRRVMMSELHAMWDYEGKLEARDWSKLQDSEVLRHRLLSPPAKMIRIFLSAAADAVVREVMKPGSWVKPVLVLGPMVGLTKEVPFSPLPLEASADTRVMAAQADDAEVDFSTWAMPDETPVQAHARQVLRKVVARWWYRNQHRKA